MPISASVTKNFKSPKYQPGSDIILGNVDDVDEAFQYNKTTRMASISVRPKLSNVYNNLLVKLVDNVSFDYTYSNSELSSVIDKKNNSKVETYKYNYIDSKSDSELEDYTFQPFKNIEIPDESKHKSFLEKVQDFKIYFRPKKIVSTGYLTINENQTISRTALDTININSKTYT